MGREGGEKDEGGRMKDEFNAEAQRRRDACGRGGQGGGTQKLAIGNEQPERTLNVQRATLNAQVWDGGGGGMDRLGGFLGEDDAVEAGGKGG